MDLADNARALWRGCEPYHAIVYFAPEAKPTYEAVGLKGGWMGYFASRSAALGPVPADVVVATFYGFAPRMVHRALPDAWRYSTPAAVAAARLRVVDAALERLLTGAKTDAQLQAAMDDTAAAARTVIDAADAAGRPLFAAHRALDWPSQPHLALWHAASCLRELRGDGHVAVLASEGIDGCECHVIAVAAGAVPVQQRQFRGWTEQEWDAATARLHHRGVLDAEGNLTEAGAKLRRHVEARTDALAAPPLSAVDAASRRRLIDGFARVSQHVADAVPYPNAVGVPPSLR